MSFIKTVDNTLFWEIVDDLNIPELINYSKPLAPGLY